MIHAPPAHVAGIRNAAEPKLRSAGPGDARISPNPGPLLAAQLEVMADLESVVEALMKEHESRREVWYPSDLSAEEEEAHPDTWLHRLRERARGLPDPCRISLALNLLTEEGLPHFHRLLAIHLGDESCWRTWNNLWTAEEDRHGAVLHDYCRDSRVVHAPSLERLRFAYLRGGFHPAWGRDPYRVFVYTTLQERATQVSHAATGRVCAEYEPRLQYILRQIAADEARHHVFYREVFAEILKRAPDQALEAAASLMPSIDMPGVSLPGFREYADVIRRIGIYGPRDYLRIVQEQIRFWRIGSLEGLKSAGRLAQERILGIPRRLEAVAEHIERRSRSKTFSFELVFRREFSLA